MRLILKRPLNDTYLDLEVPATSISVTRAINAPGEISFDVPLDYLRKKGEDGKPLLMEYGTLVIAEDDANRIIQVGIVDEVVMTDKAVQVSAGGYSMLTTGTPWLGANKTYLKADPIAIFKDIWNHVQSYAKSNLGIKVTGANDSPGYLGEPATVNYDKAKSTYDSATKKQANTQNQIKEQQATIDRLNKEVYTSAGMTFIGKVVKRKTAPTDNITKVVWCNTNESGGPSSEGVFYAYNSKTKKWDRKNNSAQKYVDWLNAKNKMTALKNVLSVDKTATTKAKEALDGRSEEKAEPYLINWWSNQDLSQTISDLTDAGPFDYREAARWDGDKLALSLELGTPQIGTRREDLVFEVGVNVIDQPTMSLQDPYTDVLLLGAGEGSAQLRSSKAWDADGRVRRVKVVTDKDQKNQQRTNNRATKELSDVQRRTGFGIDSLTVIDHSFARRTQFDVGDEIRVTGPMSDGTDLDLWVRVKEITITDTETTLQMKVEAL